MNVRMTWFEVDLFFSDDDDVVRLPGEGRAVKLPNSCRVRVTARPNTGPKAWSQHLGFNDYKTPHTWKDLKRGFSIIHDERVPISPFVIDCVNRAIEFRRTLGIETTPRRVPE